MEASVVESSSSSFPAKLQSTPWRRIWAIGDPQNLDSELVGFLCSKHCPGEIILRVFDLAPALRDAGVPVVGGFHSPMEKECLHLLLRGKQPIVVCPARGIEKMRVPKEWRGPVSEGRLLIVSPFEPKLRRPTADSADQRNHFVATLARELFIAYADPGGKIEGLCKELLNRKAKIQTFDSPHTQNLIALGVKCKGAL